MPELTANTHTELFLKAIAEGSTTPEGLVPENHLELWLQQIMEMGGVSGNYVRYTEQELSAAEEAQARDNIGAAGMEDLAPAYDSTIPYKIGNLLTYLGKQYEVTGDDGVAPPVGTLPTDTNYFTERPVSEIIEMIKTGEITVGKANLANNFDSKMVLTDNSGYLYRTTGGSLEVGEQNRVKKIIGASVPIIQIQSLTNLAASFGTYSTSTGKYTISIVGISNQNRIYSNAILPFYGGHKYLITATYLSTRNGTGILTNYNQSANSSTIGTFTFSVTANVKKTVAWITNCTTTGNADMRYGMPIGTATEVGDEIYVTNIMVLDLTATFGTTVANRLYALEQAQAGTGIAKAKEILVKDYYPYNVTAFTHTKTSGKVNNGFNQWKEDWEVGRYDNDTGAKTAGSNDRIRNKTPIPVFANTAYYAPSSISNTYYYDASGTYIGYAAPSERVNGVFTTPSNCAFVCFFTVSGYGTTYKNDICINLHWDGERDGEYEPYQEWNYPVQDIELKGILSLDAQDNWVADGDEYLPSGVVDEHWDSVDLGTLTYEYNANLGVFSATFSAMTSQANGEPSAIQTTVYATCPVGYNENYSTVDKVIWKYAGYPYLRIRDSAYTDGTSLKNALSGKYMLFKKATPTESSADSYTELQNDSNWGTEKWIDTRDVPLPVFSTCEYIPDLKAKLETAPESPEEDGDYIMHRENGLNSYGSLSTWLSANGYNKLQVLLSPLTDAAGLTYDIEEAMKIGNLVSLTIRATNLEETSISSGDPLFTLASDLIPAGTIKAYANVAGSVVSCTISNLGSVSVDAAIAQNETVAIILTYAV